MLIFSFYEILSLEFNYLILVDFFIFFVTTTFSLSAINTFIDINKVPLNKVFLFIFITNCAKLKEIILLIKFSSNF